MKSFRLALPFIIMILAGSFAALSCGSSQQSVAEPVALNISPAVADAQNFPNGQVQYTATATYSNPPHTVPVVPNFVACSQNLLDTTEEITVTTKGVAQCAQGASGTFAISASVPQTNVGTDNCPSTNGCGGGCTARAIAQLTCP